MKKTEPVCSSHTMNAPALSSRSQSMQKPAKSRTAIGNGSASVSRAASSHFTVNDLNRASSNKRCASFREGISYDSQEVVAGSLSLFAFLSASNYNAKISVCILDNKFAFETINSFSRDLFSLQS